MIAIAFIIIIGIIDLLVLILGIKGENCYLWYIIVTDRLIPELLLLIWVKFINVCTSSAAIYTIPEWRSIRGLSNKRQHLNPRHLQLCQRRSIQRHLHQSVQTRIRNIYICANWVGLLRIMGRWPMARQRHLLSAQWAGQDQGHLGKSNHEWTCWSCSR